MVKKGTVFTPHADYCLPGITRATVSIIRFQLEQLGPVYTSASLEKHRKEVFVEVFLLYLGTSLQGSMFHNIQILLNADTTRYVLIKYICF